MSAYFLKHHLFLESTMTRRKRRNHSAEFKVKVALAAIKGDHTLAELSTQFDLHYFQRYGNLPPIPVEYCSCVSN